MDLESLGRELRERRKAMRLSAAEVARDIGVSSTYLWLIEHARPRPSGEPSRPSEDVLGAWTERLGLDEEERARMRALAGYPPYALARARPRTRYSPAKTGEDVLPPASFPAAWAEAPASMSMPAAMRESVRESSSGEGEEEITEQLQSVLRVAGQRGRSQETAQLLRSFLQWLEFHIETDR